MAAAHAYHRLIVEVNEHMPRTFGEALLPVAEVHAIVEYPSGLPELPVHAAGKIDQQIGQYTLELVLEHAGIQFGIGSVPNAVAAILKERMDTQFIVTEYGVCDLRGKSTTEGALGLIELAHSCFREELLAQAKALGDVS
jgi:acyl-CoA hydrolase